MKTAQGHNAAGAVKNAQRGCKAAHAVLLQQHWPRRGAGEGVGGQVACI